MANTIGRNLNLCFTKIKRPTSSQSPFQEDHNRPLSSSTSTTLIKNFNSLYDFTLDCTTNTTTTTTTTASGHLYTSESDEEPATTPDLATAFASQRFFFSSPGRSNSIIDSSSIASTSSSSSPPESDTVVGDKIAIPTYSPDPFVDFRRSMQEMVEARGNLIDVRENWDYLHELLMCYLTLNPKSTHKFIISAFADLLVSLMASSKEHDSQKSILFNDSCKVSRRSI